MTPDLKTAARAALVEQIARICEPEGFYHGQWAVPSHRARGLAKAAAILAAIEPAIRADERARVGAEVERLRGLLREARGYVNETYFVDEASVALVARIDSELAEDTA